MHIEPGDPRWNDPFNEYKIGIFYTWKCYKNGTLVKEGTRMMRTRTQQDAQNLIERWNQAINRQVYEWRYEIL